MILVKICANCKLELSFDKFDLNPRHSTGLHSYCKACRNIKSKESYLRHVEKAKERAKNYRQNNLEKVHAYDAKRNRLKRVDNPEAVKLKKREYQLKRNFGIDLEQYQELLNAQNGGCAICGKTPEQEKRNLAVEHDHGTGEIFGLCCWSCNHRVIGRNRDPDLYDKVAQYLRKGTGLFVPLKKKKKRKPRVKQP